MFSFDPDLIAVSMFDNLVIVSKGLLLVRSIVIGVGFENTQRTLSEELLDIFTRLMISVFYSTLFMVAFYWGMILGYYFGPVIIRIYWIIYGF
jgi:hypothetical protein